MKTIKEEAAEFALCAKCHATRHNDSAEAVALHASRVLLAFASEYEKLLDECAAAMLAAASSGELSNRDLVIALRDRAQRCKQAGQEQQRRPHEVRGSAASNACLGGAS